MPVDKSTIKQRVGSIVSLPPLPSVVQKISEMVENPMTTAGDLSNMISKDTSLAAKVLRLVNSPIYGFPGKIASISHAVVLVGFNVVKGLVLGTFISKMMSQALTGLWEHSLGCSLASGIIAREIGFSAPEEASVAGLLHDVGKSAMHMVMPKNFKEIIEKVKAQELNMIEAEHKLLGITHCDLGAELGKKWNLPLNLIEPISHHHHPASAREAYTPTAIVHLADVLVRAFGFGFGGDPFVPPIDEEAWNKLGVSWEGVKNILVQFKTDVYSIKEIFL